MIVGSWLLRSALKLWVTSNLDQSGGVRHLRQHHGTFRKDLGCIPKLKDVTWPSKCFCLFMSLKVNIFNVPDHIQILPRDNWWGGLSFYSSSLDLASGSAGCLAKEKAGLKLDCLAQGNKTRNQLHLTAQPHLSYGPIGSYSMDHILDHHSLKNRR